MDLPVAQGPELTIFFEYLSYRCKHGMLSRADLVPALVGPQLDSFEPMVGFGTLGAMFDERFVGVVGIDCCDNFAQELVACLDPLQVAGSQKLDKTRIIAPHRENPAWYFL
jgi:hypothetical protein